MKFPTQKPELDRPRNDDSASCIVGKYMIRSITPEQINAGDGSQRGMVFRQAEVREIDIDARTVWVAFSSETPVERWFGEEVLDHSDGAIRLDRLKGGAALLINHDWDDQVGVIEEIEIGKDRRGRAKVRFGKSARADEIFHDVVDGIRKHVSFGYAVHKVEVESRKGKSDLVRVTDWEPYEISIVSVPADPTVGVGRSMESDGRRKNPAQTETRQKESIDMKTIVTRDAHGNLVRAKVDEHGKIVEVVEMLEEAGADVRSALQQGERAVSERNARLIEIGDKFGARDLAMTAIREGQSPEQLQTAILDRQTQREQTPLNDQGTENDLGLSDNEVRAFSFTRALRALANPHDRSAQEAAGFEFEVSRTASERAGREPQGLLVPSDVLRRALNTSTGGSAVGDTGGYAVDNTLMTSSFIDLLRNRTLAMQLGRVMGGLVGSITVPGQASGATGYWMGEDDDATETGLDLDQLGMTPKTVAGFSEITRKLLMQSSIDVEALVRADLAAALGLTIDKAFFYGTGTEHQPRGVVNYDGINAVDFTAAGKPTYAEVVEMESEIAADNADVNGMAYIMHTGMRGHFKTTEKFAGTSGATIWEPGNTVNGYGSGVTNQILRPDLIFGNFADAIIGMWGGLDLTVDPYSNSKKGRLRIIAMQDVDTVLRRKESFCIGR